MFTGFVLITEDNEHWKRDTVLQFTTNIDYEEFYPNYRIQAWRKKLGEKSKLPIQYITREAMQMFFTKNKSSMEFIKNDMATNLIKISHSLETDWSRVLK